MSGLPSRGIRGKGKIKPPRRGPDPSQETWSNLSRAIREIHRHNASHLSFEENYRYAYNMVLYKQGDTLYNGVKSLVVENLEHLAKVTLAPSFPTPGDHDAVQKIQEGENHLKVVREVWDDHVGSMSKLRDLLKYMDKVYSPSSRVPVIWDVGVQLFLDHVIHSQTHPVRQHVLSTLLAQVRLERNGHAINRSAVKGCVDVLLRVVDASNSDTTVYKSDFEPVFLKESEEFYDAESALMLENCDAPEYLRKTQQRLMAEESRTHHYLLSATDPPLQQILDDRLLTPNLTAVLSMRSSGLDAMIDTDKVEVLALLYKLFNRVPTGLGTLKKALKDSVIERGKEINQTAAGDGEGEDVEEPEEPPQGKGKGKAQAGAARQIVTVALKWVQDILDLKDKFDAVLRRAFQDDMQIQTALNEAFESVINMNSKSPEYISLFIDENLKKGLKGKTDDEVDTILDKTITVFRFVTEKDIFERYYKTHLAKRLLQGRSVSDDAERGMLAKLKVECGFQFTQKLEGMFHDMKISGETNTAYRDHLSKTVRPDIDISVQVLTSTFWPMTSTPASCTLSPEMVRSCQSFERFYLSRHSGRRLTWQHTLGNADVRVSFKAKKHDLNVSTFALVILLLFDEMAEGDILTYSDIKDSTSIPDSEVKRNLQSLACAKFKILKKHPPGREVLSDDSFSFNHEFTCPLQRIKISTIASKTENTDERRETREKIDEERKHQTDACIVRVMKDRKHMGHNELINEVTGQLASRFQPHPAHIKKRIEALIEREYLDRAEDKKSYNYLA